MVMRCREELQRGLKPFFLDGVGGGFEVLPFSLSFSSLTSGLLLLLPVWRRLGVSELVS